MKLVDSFVDIILYIRNFSRTVGDESYSYDDVRTGLLSLFDESMAHSNQNEYPHDLYTKAKMGVVAYVDEILQCSPWQYKDKWKNESLQRYYFDTTNLGERFYDVLNSLNKFGPDREVREVYSLCLGLGFKGKYFNSSDLQKYEEIKSFNLGLLLNDEAKKNIDSTVLFPMAYGVSDKRVIGTYKPRLNIIPYAIVMPIMIVLIEIIYQKDSIDKLLSGIAAIVK